MIYVQGKHIKGFQLGCPFCGESHTVEDVEFDGEDTCCSYMRCPDVGEVRVKYEFQDEWVR